MRPITANATQRKEINQRKFETVSDIALSRRRLTFRPQENLRTILPLMLSSDGGAAGVIDDDDELIGLLTEKEVLRRIYRAIDDPAIHPHNVGRYIDAMSVEDAMIVSPETLTDNIDIEDALGMMVRRGFRYMPVVSRYDRGELIGVVSERELAIHVRHRLWDAKKSDEANRSLITYFLSEPYGSGPSVPR